MTVDKDYQNFRSMIAQNPRLKSEWDKVTSELVSHVKEEFGVIVNPEDLIGISALRTRVAALDDTFDDAIKAEIQQTLPAVKKAVERREMRDAIDKETHEKYDESRAFLDSMKPDEKMRFAREKGKTPGQEPAELPSAKMTPEQKAREIERITGLNHTLRAAEYRRVFGDE